MATNNSSFSLPAMLAGVLSESFRVVSDHSRHFLALSVFFLIPLSSALIASPSPRPLLIHRFQSLPPQSLLHNDTQLSSFSPDEARTLVLALSAALALFLLIASAAAAAAAFTRIVNHGFYGRPVKILPNLKSLLIPVLRLLPTLLSGLLIFFAIIVCLCLLFLLVISMVDPKSDSVLLSVLAVVIAAGIIVSLQLEWWLFGLFWVMEFGQLKRICLWVVFGAGIGFVLWGFGLWEIPISDSWYDVMLVVVKTVIRGALTAVLLLYILVTHVVLYLCCKAVHRELQGEIVE